LRLYWHVFFSLLPTLGVLRTGYNTFVKDIDKLSLLQCRAV
jgi:hypothetical protein